MKPIRDQVYQTPGADPPGVSSVLVRKFGGRPLAGPSPPPESGRLPSFPGARFPWVGARRPGTLRRRDSARPARVASRSRTPRDSRRAAGPRPGSRACSTWRCAGCGCARAPSRAGAAPPFSRCATCRDTKAWTCCRPMCVAPIYFGITPAPGCGELRAATSPCANRAAPLAAERWIATQDCGTGGRKAGVFSR
jgi:hypothetical protein